MTTENDGRPGLPTYVRFNDIKSAGIAGSWTQLARMIDVEGFPPGVLLSSNIRGWPIHEIEAWLASRPSAKKAMPPGAIPRGRRRHAAEHEDTATV